LVFGWPLRTQHQDIKPRRSGPGGETPFSISAKKRQVLISLAENCLDRRHDFRHRSQG